MNIQCKRVHLLDRDPDRNPDLYWLIIIRNTIFLMFINLSAKLKPDLQVMSLTVKIRPRGVCLANFMATLERYIFMFYQLKSSKYCNFCT